MASTLDHQTFVYKIPDSEREDIPTPFDPPERFPEYSWPGVGKKNYVYSAIRDLFVQLGLDRTHLGTDRWNPLGEFIQPGQHVLIKPNMVLHKSYMPGEDYLSVVTHPAIIRCVLDYVYLALKGEGAITVGDAPINSAKFDVLCQNMGLHAIRNLYATRNFRLRIADFRLYTMEKDEKGIITNQRQVDSQGEHIVVRFDDESMLCDLSPWYKNFRVTEYDGDEMPVRHNVESHAYCIHRSVFEADVIFSLPKIKTHHKAGYTCAMKNYIGINGSKDWLPHHRKFSVSEGGDEYLHKSFRKRIISKSWDIRWKVKTARIQRALRMFEHAVHATHHIVPFKDYFREGSWWGNKTISRTINDLNRAVLYADREGMLRDTPQRRILYLVDGIVCGEGEGPMEATSKRCNMLVWGYNPFAVDMAVVRLMGFDWTKIDTLNVCRSVQKYKIFEGDSQSLRIGTNLGDEQLDLSTLRTKVGFQFRPPKGWIGHIELEEHP